jgi:plasmid maintenance system antidote protein VapI
MEQQMLDEIAHVMRVKGITQKDFAEHRGASRQSVNQLFTGRRGLFTDTARDLLEFLDVKIKLEFSEQ